LLCGPTVIADAGLAAAATFAFSTGRAEAFSCSVTGSSGGNPGGEPVYTCTGLVEGDVLNLSVNQTVGTDTLVLSGTLTVADISNGSVLLDLDLTNSSSPGGTANRLVSFGLGIEPDATAGTIVDLSATDTDALTSFDTGNFAGFQLVEFCATSGPNCAGGSNGGLQSGQEDLFRFSLTDGFVEGGTIDLSQFAFKFQGGAASYEKPGVPTGGSPVGGSPVAGQPVGGSPVAGQVPQPGSLMLVGAALVSALAASAGLRRVRRSHD
jgi:hypothetical protein